MQGLQPLAQQLPETLHELWFRWHAAFAVSAASVASGPSQGASDLAAAGVGGLPGTAARSALLAGLTASGSGAVDVSAWPARMLQLRLAARYAAR